MMYGKQIGFSSHSINPINLAIKPHYESLNKIEWELHGGIPKASHESWPHWLYMSIRTIEYYHPKYSTSTCFTREEEIAPRINERETLVGTPMTRGMHRYPDQLYPYPPRGHVARTSIRVPQGGIRHSQISYPDDVLSYPDLLSGSLTVTSKPCWVIPTTCHSPRSVACKAKRQERWQVTSHDL